MSLLRTTRRYLIYKVTQVSLKNIRGSWCKSDKEQAVVLFSHFSRVFHPHHDIDSNIFENNIENSLISHLLLYIVPKLFHS